jgi:class 3 adenylate cyclase
MAAPTKKSFSTPDQRIGRPGISADIVDVAGAAITRSVLEPGMHCPQISIDGKALCMAHHTGYCVQGGLRVQMADGSVLEVAANDVYDIPPGHDGMAIGPEAALTINWAGAHTWIGEPTGERVLTTLLFTDVVDSTVRALELGDRAWRELLAQHYSSVRNILDRYHGREIKTAGDGFIAGFDGAGRAISAAVAIRDRAIAEGLSIRAGVHSGEVELVGDDIAGVTVHEAARVAAAAGADEILVSEATRMLAGAVPFAFVDRGQFELKGLPGPRTLYGVVTESEAIPG